MTQRNWTRICMFLLNKRFFLSGHFLKLCHNDPNHCKGDKHLWSGTFLSWTVYWSTKVCLEGLLHSLLLVCIKKVLYFKRRIKKPSSRLLHFHIRPSYVNLLCIIVKLCAAWFHIYTRPMSLRVRKFISKEKKGSHIVVLKILTYSYVCSKVLWPLLKFIK